MVLGCFLAVLIVSGGGAAADAVPPFEAHGSVEQVYATGLAPGAEVSLLDGEGHEIATRNANQLGGTLFRNVAPGTGYRVVSGGESSPPLQVLTTESAPPSTDIYDQSIPTSGYGYLTTRDGTKLAIDVHPPQDVAKAVPQPAVELPNLLPGLELPSGLPDVKVPDLPVGQAPTLIEYSGYGYAN